MRYGVQGSAVGDRTVQMVSGGDTAQTTISGLSPSTNYSIEVAAVNILGTGTYSAVLQIQGISLYNGSMPPTSYSGLHKLISVSNAKLHDVYAFYFILITPMQL